MSPVAPVPLGAANLPTVSGRSLVLPLLELDDVAECVRAVVREELEILERRIVAQFEAARAGQQASTQSLTESQVAEMAQLSARSLRRLELRGELPAPLRFGRLKRWRRNEIEAWLCGRAPGHGSR